jgi:hypothetical protein
MTPAIALTRRAGIDFHIHQYVHDPNHPSYGEEASQKLEVDPARVFKTLVINLDGRQLPESGARPNVSPGNTMITPGASFRCGFTHEL